MTTWHVFRELGDFTENVITRFCWSNYCKMDDHIENYYLIRQASEKGVSTHNLKDPFAIAAAALIQKVVPWWWWITIRLIIITHKEVWIPDIQTWKAFFLICTRRCLLNRKYLPFCLFVLLCKKMIKCSGFGVNGSCTVLSFGLSHPIRKMALNWPKWKVHFDPSCAPKVWWVLAHNVSHL